MAQGYRARRIPVNVTDSGRCFNGLFRTRNLIEGLVLAAVPGLLVWNLFNPDAITLKIQVTTVVVGIPLIAGVFGVPPYSLVEFITLFAKYQKGKHYAKYNPRLKWETTPDFLFHGLEEPFAKQIMNAIDLLMNKDPESKNDIDTNITNPTHNEQFIEDEDYLLEHDLIPDELKTPAQRRAEAKARKKAEKEQRKKEREARKEAAKRHRKGKGDDE